MACSLVKRIVDLPNPPAPAVLTDHSPHRGEKSLTQRRSSQGHAHHQRKRRVPWRSSPLPRLTRRLVIWG